MDTTIGSSQKIVHKAGEDYLEAILILASSKGAVRSIDVANFLNYSKPSVSRAVSVLKEAGYLMMDKDHFLYLTEEGKTIAEKIYERHRFFTDFLIRVGVDSETAERDACQMEHAISAKSFEKLKEFLENHTHQMEMPKL